MMMHNDTCVEVGLDPRCHIYETDNNKNKSKLNIHDECSKIDSAKGLPIWVW